MFTFSIWIKVWLKPKAISPKYLSVFAFLHESEVYMHEERNALEMKMVAILFDYNILICYWGSKPLILVNVTKSARITSNPGKAAATTCLPWNKIFCISKLRVHNTQPVFLVLHLLCYHKLPINGLQGWAVAPVQGINIR